MIARPIKIVSEASSLGMTLLELLVALALSVLVLGMVLPLLSQLMRPSQNLDFKPESSWSRAMTADFHELISSAKCADPVVRIVAASDSDSAPLLIVETFCRAGQDAATIPPRGPNEVRYCLEPVQGQGPFALIRYAQGWHDPLSSRLIVATDLTGWTLTPAELPSSIQVGEVNSKDKPPLPIAIRVELMRQAYSENATFWVPQTAIPPSATTQPSSIEAETSP